MAKAPLYLVLCWMLAATLTGLRPVPSAAACAARAHNAGSPAHGPHGPNCTMACCRTGQQAGARQHMATFCAAGCPGRPDAAASRIVELPPVVLPPALQLPLIASAGRPRPAPPPRISLAAPDLPDQPPRA
ncbi:MAG TPA: hypothetical protein VHR45_13980 [Thermoanaerobaculia bacterium]|nr:hypothetical protein [Thermoanaerobaculia bacterium]